MLWNLILSHWIGIVRLICSFLFDASIGIEDDIGFYIEGKTSSGKVSKDLLDSVDFPPAEQRIPLPRHDAGIYVFFGAFPAS